MAGAVIIDHEATDTDSRAKTMKCMICGRLSDPVIEKNRTSPLPKIAGQGNRLIMNTFRKQQENRSKRKRNGAEV